MSLPFQAIFQMVSLGLYLSDYDNCYLATFKRLLAIILVIFPDFDDIGKVRMGFRSRFRRKKYDKLSKFCVVTLFKNSYECQTSFRLTSWAYLKSERSEDLGGA